MLQRKNYASTKINHTAVGTTVHTFPVNLGVQLKLSTLSGAINYRSNSDFFNSFLISHSLKFSLEDGSPAVSHNSSFLFCHEINAIVHHGSWQ